MTLSCNVIQDLLPLYHDGVCSQESRAAVEAHVKECRTCAELLARMDEELDCPRAAREEAGPLRAIRAAWEKTRRAAFRKGALLAALLCAALAGGILGLTQWKIVPVSPEVLEVSEITRRPDGAIAFHLFVNDNKNLRFIKFTTTPDGSFYLTPMRSVLEGRRRAEIGLFDQSFALSAAEEVPAEASDVLPLPSGVTSVSVGPVGGGILVWEKDMPLPSPGETPERG